MNVHFSSKTDLHATPQDFFDKLNKEFNFTLDVCATPQNAKCKAYYTESDDGLSMNWYGNYDGSTDVIWMNPPYGDPEHVCKKNCKKKKCITRGFHNKKYKPGIVDWMKKADDAANHGCTVVCLVPARTDTKWWHDYAIHHEIRFVKGRLKFGDAKNSAPFPSAVVVMRFPRKDCQ